jgi:hypothetical protein
MQFQEIFIALKKNKLLYYAKNFVLGFIPASIFGRSLEHKLGTLGNYDRRYIIDRINYYNKLAKCTPLGDDAVRLEELKNIGGPRAYFFDTYETTRYFDQNLKANVLFMDVIHVPDVPTLQKSRPIAGDNANAVLLKLDKKRHFLFVKDHKRFSEKKNLLIGRGAMSQPHRIRFMDMYFGHPLCDLGEVNREGGNSKWIKPKISITDHLDFKFILSLEGNDVATNLKWIMSSHSVAVMPKPKYETWFMEGRLIPDYHFIMIKDDYSDLEERLRYYLDHPAEGEAIVRNASEYVRQFFDEKREDLISLMVLQKYFFHTNESKGL